MSLVEDRYDDYMHGLLTGDDRYCAHLLHELLKAGVPVQSLLIDLMHRSMYEIGERWASNDISIATEHMASATTRKLLGRVFPALHHIPADHCSAIIACTPHNIHQIGPHIVAEIFTLHGWKATSLAHNVRPDELINIIRERKPDVVGISVSMIFDRADIEGLVTKVSDTFPDLPIVVGGHAFNIPEEGTLLLETLKAIAPKLRYLDSIAELEAYIDSFQTNCQ
jgi:methanogenic corrinoid protein MtbC1